MARGSNFHKPYPPEFRREAVELVRRSGRPLREVAISDLDRDAADVGAPGRRRRRPAGGADERGADGAARAAPEGEDARAGTRDLEKSRGLLRAGERDAVSCFRFVAAEKTNHPISLMCRVLGVSRSGFHAWEQRAPSERALVDARLSERIREMYARSRDSYGARRIYLDLRDEDVRVGRKRVERLMRAAGLSGYVKRRKFRTTFGVPGVRVADDLVERDFNPSTPNRLWASDIKYVSTWEGHP